MELGVVVQWPAPSQACASTAVPALLQDFMPHIVPLEVLFWPAHDCHVFPSHTGVSHSIAPVHGDREPCGAPTAPTQVPSEPLTSQAAHWSVHATLQQ
jgi:hypothetical protein